MDKEHQPKAYWAMINFVTISDDIRRYGIDLKLDEKYYSKTLCDYICNITFQRFCQTYLFKERILGIVETGFCIYQSPFYDTFSKIAGQLIKAINLFSATESTNVYGDDKSAIVDYNTFACMVDMVVTSTMIEPEDTFDIMRLKRLLHFYNILQQQQDNIYCLIETVEYNDIDIDTSKDAYNKRWEKMLEENKWLKNDYGNMYYKYNTVSLDCHYDYNLHKLPSVW